MVNHEDTVAVLHALRELSEGQSYFREHLQHAQTRILELEQRCRDMEAFRALELSKLLKKEDAK